MKTHPVDAWLFWALPGQWLMFLCLSLVMSRFWVPSPRKRLRWMNYASLVGLASTSVFLIGSIPIAFLPPISFIVIYAGQFLAAREKLDNLTDAELGPLPPHTPVSIISRSADSIRFRRWPRRLRVNEIERAIILRSWKLSELLDNFLRDFPDREIETREAL